MTKAKKKLTIKRVDRYLELLADKRELDRQSRVMAREIDSIKQLIADELDANKGKPFTKGKYAIRYIEKPGRVKWKDEFIEAAGIDAAQKLMNEAEPLQVVDVQ